jgi:hypothetical protein
MLRREEGALGPDDGLKLAHGLSLKLAGAMRESQKRFHPRIGTAPGNKIRRDPLAEISAHGHGRDSSIPNAHVFRLSLSQEHISEAKGSFRRESVSGSPGSVWCGEPATRETQTLANQRIQNLWVVAFGSR